MRLSIGIDLGFGVKSATAVSIIDQECVLLHSFQVTPGLLKDEVEKLQYISRNVAHALKKYFGDDHKKHQITVTLETCVMQGKSGATMQRLLGAIVAALPQYMEIKYCHNMTLKKKITGSGLADKKQMGEAAIKLAASYKARSTVEVLEKWLDRNDHDLMDSYCLAVSEII